VNVRSPFLTRAEAAGIARVSVRTIDRARRAGRLRAGGTRGAVRIHVDDLVAWLERPDEPKFARRPS
jgi:excisionase family DNA binding protein